MTTRGEAFLGEDKSHIRAKHTQVLPVQRYGQTSHVWSQANANLDHVVIEEPLEIRLEYFTGGEWQRKSVSVTMRTPGHDRELAAGFLMTEGVLKHPGDIVDIKSCGPEAAVHGGQNIVRVILKDGIVPPVAHLERHFYTTSSCGICGKSSLDAVRAQGIQKIPRDGFRLSEEWIYRLPDILRTHQDVFSATGAIHAAALVTADGKVSAVYEDVGRHNAVDKVLGDQFLRGRTTLSDHMIIVSGRAGFELVQKSLVGGVAALLAIGAPSSLSVSLAEAFDMTLVGFMRDNRFNVYSGSWRICDSSRSAPLTNGSSP